MDQTVHKAALDMLSTGFDLPEARIIEMLDNDEPAPRPFAVGQMRDFYLAYAKVEYVRNRHPALRRPEISNEAREQFAEQRRKYADFEARKPAIRAAGVEALRRLMAVAQGHSGQCRRVAAFLLSCYNGERFKFDLTDFRTLDLELFEDCLTVLQMDYAPYQEVHRYFENGGEMFEHLAKAWAIRDYTKPRTNR